jgi:hypothetical protein
MPPARRMISATNSRGSGRPAEVSVGIDQFDAGGGTNLGAGAEPTSRETAEIMLINSSSDNSLRSFLAIAPECLSPTGVSRHRARVLSEKICAMTRQGIFLPHVWATTVETLAGFALGVIGGVALGIALGMTRRVRQILMPYLLAIYGIPRPALTPLFVLCFGIWLFSKIVLIVSLAYFLLLI